MYWTVTSEDEGAEAHLFVDGYEGGGEGGRFRKLEGREVGPIAVGGNLADVLEGIDGLLNVACR